MQLTKEQMLEFARTYVNYKGSDSRIDKEVAQGLVEALGHNMDNLYNNPKPELEDNQARRLRR